MRPGAGKDCGRTAELCLRCLLSGVGPNPLRRTPFSFGLGRNSCLCPLLGRKWSGAPRRLCGRVQGRHPIIGRGSCKSSLREPRPISLSEKVGAPRVSMCRAVELRARAALTHGSCDARGAIHLWRWPPEDGHLVSGHRLTPSQKPYFFRRRLRNMPIARAHKAGQLGESANAPLARR